MSRYLEIAKQGKNDFMSHLLTLLLVSLVLISSSSIASLLYLLLTGDQIISHVKMLTYFGKNGMFLLQLLPVTLSLVCLLACIKWIHKRPIISVFTARNKFDWKRFRFSFLLWLFFLLLLFTIDYLLAPQNIRWQYQAQNFWPLVLISLIFVSLQTLFEEILFRGYLLQAFGAVIPQKWILVLITSLFFMAVHLGNPEVELIGFGALVYFFACGVLLAPLTLLDHGIELAFGFHAINNLFGALFVTNNWQIFQTHALFLNSSEAEMNIAQWITIALVFPFLIYIYEFFE